MRLCLIIKGLRHTWMRECSGKSDVISLNGVCTSVYIHDPINDTLYTYVIVDFRGEKNLTASPIDKRDFFFLIKNF